MGSDGDWLIGFGVLLVIIGPLLNLLVIWLLHRYLVSRIITVQVITSVTISMLLLAAAHLAAVLPGRLAFTDLCLDSGKPVVLRRDHVDGFFRTKMFQYEAMQYLREGGFSYVEAPDPYKPGILLRYSLDIHGEISKKEIPKRTSRYEVSDDFEQLSFDISVNRKAIKDIWSGDTVANASMISFHGFSVH